MKIKYVFLPTVMAVALTLLMFGQNTHADKTKTDRKLYHPSSMMGKPTVDATVEGLHMKIWLMTERQHKRMMKGKMGQMMMHGEKEGEMEHMVMSDMKDTSMMMGKDMKGMKHEGMGMSKAMMDSMMAGTHYIMLDVTDAATKKRIPDASAKLMIMTPSKKHSSVDLKPIMTYFESGLRLAEKGKYHFVVTVNVNGNSKTKEFQYSVK